MSPARRSSPRWWLTVVSGSRIEAASTRPHASPVGSLNKSEMSLTRAGLARPRGPEATSIAAESLSGSPAANGGQPIECAWTSGLSLNARPFAVEGPDGRTARAPAFWTPDVKMLDPPGLLRLANWCTNENSAERSLEGAQSALTGGHRIWRLTTFSAIARTGVLVFCDSLESSSKARTASTSKRSMMMPLA